MIFSTDHSHNLARTIAQQTCGILIAYWLLVFSAAALAQSENISLISLRPSNTQQHPDYFRLLQALQRYKAIEQQGGWPEIPAGPTLKPGMSDRRIPSVWQRLRITGDLPYGQSLSENSMTDYNPYLATAVRRFQYRHGLQIDGILGPATRKAFNVSVSERVRQLQINLVRLQNSADLWHGRYLAVNIADATLKLVEDSEVLFTSRVIVGTRRTRTPVFSAQLRAIVFNPPWNIPYSIATKEILPKLPQNPYYLENQKIIITNRPADPYGLAIDWSKADISQFGHQLRQLPGTHNALGQIKFDIANNYSIYLHDTPNKRLFNQAKRTFSHGCVRVENPQQLALYLLTDQAWQADDITHALSQEMTQRIPLTRPVPVHLVYLTAFVDAGDLVHFREDIYGHDNRFDFGFFAD